LKVPQNPIAVAPPGFSSDKFRDPTTAWKGPDGEWRILVGSSEGEDNRDGTALLYKSKDFSTWQFSQPLHSVNGTGMWECPDFFPVRLSGKLGVEPSSLGPGVKHVLKISSEDKKHDYYVVGNYSIETDTFVPDSPQLDAGLGLRYDYGKLYASKTFFDQFTNRRINFGWINESDSEEADVSKGWASIMVLSQSMHVSLCFLFLVLMFYTWLCRREGLLIIMTLCTTHATEYLYDGLGAGDTKKDLVGCECPN